MANCHLQNIVGIKNEMNMQTIPDFNLPAAHTAVSDVL